MPGFPAFEGLIFAFCKGKLRIYITKPADRELCRFDNQRWSSVPIQGDVPTAGDRHGLIAISVGIE
ncbi:MAG: hypothetical protein P1U89_20435 [Verrucomicrobiales bacterium]|nr:hypothetical protein [Verrucomicrobiales bacterium]